MGNFFSRQNDGVEEVDLGPSHTYKYPPKAGEYLKIIMIWLVCLKLNLS